MPQAASPASPSEITRLAKFIAVSLAIHVVILVLTSIPFILRGFKPAPGPTPAAAATPAKPAAAAASGAAAKADGSAAAPAGSATPAGDGKPATKGKPKDPDAEYGKDKTASPDELKTSSPSIDSELGK